MKPRNHYCYEVSVTSRLMFTATTYLKISSTTKLQIVTLFGVWNNVIEQNRKSFLKVCKQRNHYLSHLRVSFLCCPHDKEVTPVSQIARHNDSRSECIWKNAASFLWTPAFS